MYIWQFMYPNYALNMVKRVLFIKKIMEKKKHPRSNKVFATIASLSHVMQTFFINTTLNFHSIYSIPKIMIIFAPKKRDNNNGI